MVIQVEIISELTNKMNDTSMEKGKKKLIWQHHPTMEPDLQLWRRTNRCSEDAVGCASPQMQTVRKPSNSAKQKTKSQKSAKNMPSLKPIYHSKCRMDRTYIWSPSLFLQKNTSPSPRGEFHIVKSTALLQP